VQGTADSVGGNVHVWSSSSDYEPKATRVHTEQPRERIPLLGIAPLCREALARTALDRAFQAELIHQSKES
jgi:hypothetical protein